MNRTHATPLLIHSPTHQHTTGRSVSQLPLSETLCCAPSYFLSLSLQAPYYHAHCGKGFMACSCVGGTVVCSALQGGPADDHQCMVQGAKFWAKEKWAVEEGQLWPKHLYDNGVHQRTKAAALEARCDLLTSGFRRQSADNALSGMQRLTNRQHSTYRIRVENFICRVKQHFMILSTTFVSADIPIMDAVVYVCYMLHNFRSATTFYAGGEEM